MEIGVVFIYVLEDCLEDLSAGHDVSDHEDEKRLDILQHRYERQQHLRNTGHHQKQNKESYLQQHLNNGHHPIKLIFHFVIQ
jgi:hypothetical protein